MKTPGNRSDYREFFYNFVPYRPAVTAVSGRQAPPDPSHTFGAGPSLLRGRGWPRSLKQRSLQVRDSEL